MEDDLNRRRPQGRQPPWQTTSRKTTSMADNLNGRQPQWKIASMGKKCQWRITSMEEDLKEALKEDDISLFS